MPKFWHYRLTYETELYREGAFLITTGFLKERNCSNDLERSRSVEGTPALMVATPDSEGKAFSLESWGPTDEVARLLLSSFVPFGDAPSGAFAPNSLSIACKSIICGAMVTVIPLL